MLVVNVFECPLVCAFYRFLCLWLWNKSHICFAGHLGLCSFLAFNLTHEMESAGLTKILLGNHDLLAFEKEWGHTVWGVIEGRDAPPVYSDMYCRECWMYLVPTWPWYGKDPKHLRVKVNVGKKISTVMIGCLNKMSVEEGEVGVKAWWVIKGFRKWGLWWSEERKPHWFPSSCSIQT